MFTLILSSQFMISVCTLLLTHQCTITVKPKFPLSVVFLTLKHPQLMGGCTPQTPCFTTFKFLALPSLNTQLRHCLSHLGAKSGACLGLFLKINHQWKHLGPIIIPPGGCGFQKIQNGTRLYAARSWQDKTLIGVSSTPPPSTTLNNWFNCVLLKMKDLWLQQFNPPLQLCLLHDWDVSYIILELNEYSIQVIQKVNFQILSHKPDFRKFGHICILYSTLTLTSNDLTTSNDSMLVD